MPWRPLQAELPLLPVSSPPGAPSMGYMLSGSKHWRRRHCFTLPPPGGERLLIARPRRLCSTLQILRDHCQPLLEDRKEGLDPRGACAARACDCPSLAACFWRPSAWGHLARGLGGRNKRKSTKSTPFSKCVALRITPPDCFMYGHTQHPTAGRAR